MTGVGDPLLGQLIDGRYQVTRRLARGGMATVYSAVDTRLTRTVALKVMHVGLGDDAEFARKFDREARSAARLTHPNVVSVFDQGHDGGRPYIVMEYVDGYTLRDVIGQQSPLPPQRALETIEPVLSALACAHDAGLVHRDVKPENVLISERGQIKVADFGLAKAITSQTSTATQGLLIGTVSYLPPELVISGKADARSDVYSAGVVLFELLTGRKPHTGETPIQVAYAHVHEDVPAPSQFRTAGPIPRYLDALIARATARDPRQRPADAKALLAQVRRVREALAEGRTDDPELTEDLTPPESGDPSDREVTQLVAAPLLDQPGSFRRSPSPSSGPSPTASPPSWSQPQSAWTPTSPATHSGAYAGSSTAPSGPSSPPTVRDAEPPGYSQPELRRLSAERLHAQREREARRRRRGWLILLLVLMLATAATLTGWYLTEGRFTTAPALTTLPQAEAETIAEKTGLQLNLTSVYSENVATGVVVSTDPTAGTKILSGGTMTAAVSKGPERYTMPAVTGLTRAAAASALTEAHLAVGVVTDAYHPSVPDGKVISASQSTGARLRSGTKISLSVSKGPQPITIESFVGKPAGAAESALKKAGFTVEKSSAHSDSVPSGSVISQDPAKGKGFKGDKITLQVSLGPVMVTIPNTRRMGVKDARELLESKGFRVKVQPVAVNYLGVGYVVMSRPGASSRAPKGSTVTLYVV